MAARRPTVRRPIARPLALAAATAVALGATALAAVPAAAAEVPLKDYALTWGIKESYRSYVTGMAAGEITVADGAEQAPENGPFTFVDGTGSYDSGSHTVDLAFKGAVTFKSTLHGFEVALSDVRFDSGAAQVTVDVTKDGKTAQDVPFADVTVDRAMKDMDTKLTEQADAALGGGGRYTGAAGDPLTVAPAETTPGPDPSDGPTDEPTGQPSERPTDEPSATPSPTQKPTQKPTASPSTTAPARPASGEVVDGSLSWGLKESFRRYISSGGEIRTAGGSKETGNGFDWPHAKAELDSDAKKLSASFGGTVQFLYKAHGIDMKFADVKIEADGAEGTLRVDVTTPKGTADDVEFATLDLSKASYAPKDDIVLLDTIPAKFTADGAQQFANDTTGSLYKEGDPIDPVTVALSLAEGAQLPGGGAGSGSGGGTGGAGGSVGGSVGGGSVGGTGSLAATGSGVPAGALLGAAGAVAVAGAGVLYAVRRRTFES